MTGHALAVSPGTPQSPPEARAQQHMLHDFDLTAIGIVLVAVLAILGLRRAARRLS